MGPRSVVEPMCNRTLTLFNESDKNTIIYNYKWASERSVIEPGTNAKLHSNNHSRWYSLRVHYTGFAVGFFVGLNVGLNVGLKVGDTVGDTVGFNVGV